MTADIFDRRSAARSGGVHRIPAIHRIRGDHAAEAPMFAIGLGFLALFSVISILIGNDDPRPGEDARSDLVLWTRFAR
jgi:hypothetical protein